MSRWKAALLHLCISSVIAAIAVALLLGVWYPPPYFQAGGGAHLLALVVGVDVSIGPLLTFIVFKSGKRGLKLDLAVIGGLQAIALVYGFSVMVRSRPVFLVAAVDRFVLVDADQIHANDLAQASRPEWKHLSWTGPITVGAELPKDPVAREKVMFTSFRTGQDIQDWPKYYVPYAAAAPALLKRARPVSALLKLYPDQRDPIDRWLARHGASERDARWLPIQSRAGDLVMLVRARDGQPIGALPLDPWPSDATTVAKKNKSQPSGAKPKTGGD